METTVEGIERVEQFDAVKAEGCTEMQGFLCGRAMPSEEIDRLFFSGGGDVVVPSSPAAA